MLTDGTDGFGGLSVGCMEHLNDEYERKSLMVVPLFPPLYKDNVTEVNTNEWHRLLNTCLLFDSLNEYSSLFVPMSTASECWKEPRKQIDFHRINYDVSKSLRDHQLNGIHTL